MTTCGVVTFLTGTVDTVSGSVKRYGRFLSDNGPVDCRLYGRDATARSEYRRKSSPADDGSARQERPSFVSSGGETTSLSDTPVRLFISPDRDPTVL